MSDEARLRWLHISDLHFQSDEQYARRVILRTLLQHVDEQISKEEAPDLIFVSGDIGNTGSADEYDKASEFLDELIRRSGLSKDRLIVVPGNHDVHRPSGVGLARSILDLDEIDRYFSPEFDKPQISLKQRWFARWFNTYFDGVRRFPTNTSCAAPVEINIEGTTIGIICINSAMFCQDDNDFGQLLIGRRALDTALSEMDELNPYLRLAVVHHPLDWLADAERSNIVAKLRSGVDILLRGHLHETGFEAALGIGGENLSIAAGATYQGSDRPNTAVWATLHDSSVEIHPVRFESRPLEVWTTDTSLFPHQPLFRKRIPLSRLVRERSISPTTSGSPAKEVAPEAAALISQLRSEAERDLFVSPAGELLYVEPRIMSQPQDYESLSSDAVSEEGARDVVESAASYFIEAEPDFGGTTLARKLRLELLEARGILAELADARTLPNYQKKLAQAFSHVTDTGSGAVLILDNFDDSRDFKLLREIAALKIFDRFIVINSARYLKDKTVVQSQIDIDFEYRHLWGMNRLGVRTIANALFLGRPIELVSLVVDKVYSDLLHLGIPLTPANVIMYQKVLYHEQDFQPLNQVDIVDHYLREMLRKPGDIYQSSFNLKNKMDVLSAFIYELYREEKGAFYEEDWKSFCERYQKSTLSHFDQRDFLHELVSTRVFINVGRSYFLKYSFFYSFLLGRFVANRPAVLDQFLSQEEYYRISGIVEAISGQSADNSPLLNTLLAKLSGLLAQFDETYVDKSFDPLAGAQWPDSDTEDDEVWAPIAKEIRDGPREPEEIDIIKSSLQSEARSRKQEVVFSRFSELEILVFRTTSLLEEALKSSDEIDGELKIRCMRAVFAGYFIVLQLATLLSSVIASSRYVRWGGILFINASDELEESDDEPEVSPWVIIAANRAVSQRVASRVGTKKLGEVFKAIEEQGDLTDFERFVNFCCLLAAKPGGWDSKLSDAIRTANKNSYRLRAMVHALARDYRDEVNLHGDREELKRLIALVQVKRQSGKKSPGERSVSKMLRRMKKSSHFDRLLSPKDEPDKTGD